MSILARLICNGIQISNISVCSTVCITGVARVLYSNLKCVKTRLSPPSPLLLPSFSPLLLPSFFPPRLPLFSLLRWGDAASPAFGDLEDSHFVNMYSGTVEERTAAWGESPLEEEDVYKVFEKYIAGSPEVNRIPWYVYG